MKQFFHSCDFVVSRICAHQVILKALFYGLLIIGAVWAMTQSQHHVLLDLHTQVFGYKSDPWNG